MKKLFLIAMALTIGVSVMAQQKIQLRSADRAECVKSDMTSLKASFSFSTIDAQDYESERGTFSWLSLPNTVIGGNEGDPQIPVVNKLIAVPFGANPSIEITSYSTTDYRLDDYDIHTLVPRQPSLRKDQRPEDVPFVYNASAYQTRGLRSAPQAVVSVEGTMRGIQVGKMTIEPVSYDPVNNTLRVFNNIEVEVHFDGADAAATKQMLIDTYSPYFNTVYTQMFNGRSLRDAYSDHPDLYNTPVKMLVITTSTYANNTTFQEWVTWKKQKGIYIDVYTTAQTGTTAANIKSFIQTQYNQNHPTFLVIVGDSGDVTQSATGTSSQKYTDLYYSSPDGDIFPDIYTSRMPVSSSDELTYLLTKTLQYEQYTMPDPSYLDETLLIAGWDATWTPRVGKPTIQYANTYYYNSDHGITADVFLTTGSGQTECYNYINQVGFVNYTAHGSETSWQNPAFELSDVNSLTNTNKYFWAMGNCCLAANWGYNGTCYAEAMLRGQNKGAWGYIGSCPSTYWWEDYYFGVGATSVINQMPTQDQTQTGVYDAMFDDSGFNTLNAVPFFGNVAVTYSHAGSYESSVTDQYYWEAYHCLGDGSVMPYQKNPSANQVSHAATIGIGLNTFTVNALPGSYVSITKDNEILGVAQVDATGIANVPITPVTSGGDVLIVVTRQQRQPYMQTIQAVSLDGPYISLDSYTPTSTHVGDNTNLSITFKNVGAYSTTGNTNVTLSANDPSVVTILQPTGSFGALAPEATTTVNGFSFKIAEGVADGTIVTLHYIAENGSDTYEGNIAITANEAVLEYKNMAWNGGFVPGETLTLSATFKNTGHYQATNAMIELTTTANNYVTINTQPISAGTIEAGQEVTYDFSVTIAANCPETAVLPVIFTMTADGGLTAIGTENLKNSCNVIFNLIDSYGDGWNGAALVVSFDDGTESQSLTISSGNSTAEYVLEIGNGVHVTLTWSSGSWDGECSFSVSYEGDLLIYQSSGTPSAGVLYEFDCNCAAATQTFTVTATSSNTEQGTVSGGGEFNFGASCTVTATPAEGYMFSGWTWNGSVVSGSAEYTFSVTSDMDLVAHFAEGTMIGDGGDATSSYLPSYNFYDYSLSQQIYTVEELGAPGLITSIAFYNAGAEKTRTYDFYMKNTEKSTFSGASDWETVTDADKVFSGSVTMTADAWTFIVLDTPFIYDGSSNVVLVSDDNTGGYTSSPHMACRVFNATGQALYKYQDATNLNPFAPSSISGTVMDQKNQIIITKESLGDCVRPTQLTATEIGPDFIELSWIENGASEEWVVDYSVDGVFVGQASTTMNPFTITGLDSETTYVVKVRPLCDENLWSNAITITTLEACPVPQDVEVNSVTGNAATVTWNGYNDSYLVQLGVPAFLISESFDNGIPASWTNDANYAWTVVDGHIQSGNGGVESSTSSISATVTFPAVGTIEFDAECMGEGTSTYWDHCDFYIDEERMVYAGANVSGWNHYSFDVVAGEHTFTWSYTKDGSVNPTGDYFAVDNVVMKSGETNWNDPVAVEETEHTFAGLTPLTTYCVRVKGICGEDETEWSEVVVFATGELTIVTQTIALAEGWNWVSIYVEGDPIELLQMLEAALGDNAVSINASEMYTEYYGSGFWIGDLDDVGITNEQMYMVEVLNDCEIELDGLVANPANHEVTIYPGWNWIGFPCSQELSIEDAFADFDAEEGDQLTEAELYTEYGFGMWIGDVETLVPGRGYMYYSNSSEEKTLIFQTGAKAKAVLPPGERK